MSLRLCVPFPLLFPIPTHFLFVASPKYFMHAYHFCTTDSMGMGTGESLFSPPGFPVRFFVFLFFDLYLFTFLSRIFLSTLSLWMQSVYVYVFVCMCVCVFVCMVNLSFLLLHFSFLSIFLPPPFFFFNFYLSFIIDRAPLFWIWVQMYWCAWQL